MINLKMAYKSGLKLKRDPKSVKLQSITRYISKKDCCKSVGTFRSSAGDIKKCFIQFPYEKGRVELKVFKSGNTVKMKPLDERYLGLCDCECEDFLYTFYPAIHSKKGNLKERVTSKPKGTGVKRSIDKPGLCKHIMALIDLNIKEKFIKKF